MRLILQINDWNHFAALLEDAADKYERLGDMEVRVKADAEYSGFVEYGTYKMGAQPFFIDNFLNGATELQRVFDSDDPTPDGVKQVAHNIAGVIQNDAAVDTGFMRDNVHVEE